MADIRGDNGNCARDRGSVHAIPRQRSNSCRTPQCCGRIESRDVQPIPQDYPGTQEADPRNNLSCDPKAIVRACGKGREHDEHGRAGRHQSVCPKPGHTLPPLAFGPNEGSEDQC